MKAVCAPEDELGAADELNMAELFGPELIGPYAYAAHRYVGGLGSPLPLPLGEKYPPPEGFTGSRGRAPLPSEIQRWTWGPTHHNIALRLDGDVIGLDVDQYGAKAGAEHLAAKEAEWGKLPPTWRSTSKGADNPSGIRLYRVPMGTRLQGGFGNVEVIQRHHRYMVVAPSVHRDGNVYEWYDDAGEQSDRPPYWDDLPMLPSAWIEELRSVGDGTTAVAAAPEEVRQFVERHTDSLRPQGLKGLESLLAAKAGSGRHDTLIEVACMAAREVAAGWYTMAEAGAVLSTWWRSVMDNARRLEGTEFDDAIAWAVSQVDTAAGQRQIAEKVEQTKTVRSNLTLSFYDERPMLRTIHAAAHATTCAPDAVLAGVLARVAVLTPPWIKLPNPVGTPATLDLCVAVIGRSGTGKSAAQKVADQLMSILGPDPVIMPLGSGEGIIEGYMGFEEEAGDDGKKRKVRQQVRRSILFQLDEGQALGELGSRKGSTLMETIRSAAHGGRLGQANASEERFRHLAPGEYRFALETGIQTEHATSLIDDAAGGTPQRFLYFAAEDPTIPDEPVDWPGKLDYKPPTHTSEPMTLDREVAQEIRKRKLARTRGHVTIDPLDAHRDLNRLKVAGLLALFDGRVTITADDWRLSGDVLDASDRVRQSIVDAAKDRAQHSERNATARVIRRNEAVEESAEARALSAVARAIARHVHRGTCTDGCKRRCLTQAAPGKYRAIASVDEGIEEAMRLGWIDESEGTYRPGSSQPT